MTEPTEVPADVVVPELKSPLKTQRSVEVPSNSNPSLAEMIEYLEGQDFDPESVRYESPLSKTPSYDDLRALGRLKRFEIAVMGIREDGENKMRVVTGGQANINTHTLSPSLDRQIGHFRAKGIGLDSDDFGKEAAKINAYYPIVEDDGAMATKKWGFRVHNHPSGTLTPGVEDLRSSIGVEMELIVSEAGLAVITHTGKPSGEMLQDLPESKRTLSSEDLITDSDFRKFWMALAESRALSEFEDALRSNPLGKHDLHIMTRRKAAELMGIEVRRLDWEKDRAEVEGVAANLLQ